MATIAGLFTLADGVLLLLLLTMSIVELRTELIPNGLVLAGIVAWLGTTALTGGWPMSLAGAALGFGSALAVWLRGRLGGGIAKAALPIGGLLSLIGAAVVVVLAVGYEGVRFLRGRDETVPFAPRVMAFALLFIAGRVAVALYRG